MWRHLKIKEYFGKRKLSSKCNFRGRCFYKRLMHRDSSCGSPVNLHDFSWFQDFSSNYSLRNPGNFCKAAELWGDSGNFYIWNFYRNFLRFSNRTPHFWKFGHDLFSQIFIKHPSCPFLWKFEIFMWCGW